MLRRAPRCVVILRRGQAVSRTSTVTYSDVELATVPEVKNMIGVRKELKQSAPGVRVMNREASSVLIETLHRIEHREPSASIQDEDWQCPYCDFVNFASKSKRMFCAKCHRTRSPLPSRRSYLLTGQRGIGKSMALARVVQWARARGWVAVFVPSAWHYVNMGHWVTPSEHIADKFEQPHGALEVLRSTLVANRRSSLEAVKLQTDTARERWGVNTLTQLLEVAIEEDKFEDASTAVADVVAELAEAEAVPVLLAVDEISSWFADKVDHWFRRVRLSPTDVAGVDLMLKPLLDPNFRFKRGTAVYADSSCRPIKLKQPFRKLLSHMPIELRINPLSDDEFGAAVEWYTEFMHVGKSLDSSLISTLKMATQRNPQSLHEHMLLAAFDLYDDEKMLDYEVNKPAGATAS